MSPHHELSQQACLLLFITMILAEIHLLFFSKESKILHNFGQPLKLQSAVVTLNISPRSSTS